MSQLSTTSGPENNCNESTDEQNGRQTYRQVHTHTHKQTNAGIEVRTPYFGETTGIMAI